MHLRDHIKNQIDPEAASRDHPAAPLRLSKGQQLRALGIAAAIVVVIGVSFTLFAPGSQEAPTPQPATVPGTFKPTPNQWAALNIKPVSEVAFRTLHNTDGSIILDDDLVTQVFSPYSGRVSKIVAKPGDRVNRGDPLFTVQASEFTQGESDLITAKAQHDLAVANEHRQRELYDARGAAMKDWMQAQADLASASAALNAARSRLRILGVGDAEIARMETRGQTPQSSTESLVTAPIAGTVLQRQVGLGQYIQSGAATPVYAIGNLGKVWLVANVRETDASAMHVGAAVDVHVLAFPDRVFKARLNYVASELDSTTHRLPVRAEVENPDQALKPQMFANFSIASGDERMSPAVPETAIITEGDAARLWVAHDDRSLELRAIRTGRVANGDVEVLNGVAAGEKVVVAGTLFIDRAAKPD